MADKAAALAAAGIDRASLGVQDVNRHVQEAINRIQPFEMTAGAAGALRAAGIRALNFDIMYGLPHQSVEDMERSATLAASLRPQRISVFGYAPVPWMKKHQKMIETAALRSEAHTSAIQSLMLHSYAAFCCKK